MNKKLIPHAGELRDTIQNFKSLARYDTETQDDYNYYNGVADSLQQELDTLLDGKPFPHISLFDLMEVITSLNGAWDDAEIVFHGYEGRVYLNENSELVLEFNKEENGEYFNRCEGLNDIFTTWKFRWH